ncbi:MAG: exo-alpha-sialidase [Akkermansia sp.]|nr:exo-alpha-sialidase [Akkermansia sp.]
MFNKFFVLLLAGGLLVGAECLGNSLTVTNPGVWPLMKRAKFNPAVKVTIQTDESKGVQKFDKFEVMLEDPGQVARITLRTGDDKANFKDSVEFGSAEPKEGKVVSIKPTGRLERGETVLWLDVEPSEESIIGSEVTIKGVKATIGGKAVKAEMEPVSQRIGIMLAFPGEDVAQLKGAARPCAAFRIPGLIQTKKGTLIGCFDARYDNEVDLCRDIDVAAVRSTDGGQTWTLPKVNMDSGPGMANGCGDPCILQDKKGRIWMQALACHFGPGSRAINSSGTGTDPSRTGQWEMVYSDNEGKSWSKIVNVTKQVKKDEWTLILAGPGNGICTKDGTIVFPAQIWQNGADPVCRSTICYSKDGRKWKMAPPVPGKTSECQVVELKDGSLMLNCRHEGRSGRRAVYVTSDMGETWDEHETHCKALSEPVCQASLIAVETKKYGRVLLFSNPKQHGRSNMTVRASQDEGKTWNEGLLYDARDCCGYSCLAMTDPDHVGVIYETCHTNGENGFRGIGFIRLPLKTIVTGEAAKVKAAKLKISDEDDKEAGDAAPKKSKKGRKSKTGKKKGKKKK